MTIFIFNIWSSYIHLLYAILVSPYHVQEMSPYRSTNNETKFFWEDESILFDLIHMTSIKSGSTKMNKMKSQKNDSLRIV